MPEFVYTIGHSNHSIGRFIELLRTHHITAVADVRSHPHSRFNPQFNLETLQADLKQVGMGYVFLGRELGARPEDPSCYINGTVHYKRLAHTPLFQVGLSRLVSGAATHRIAIMCAEKDPLTCHRAILVCRNLVSLGICAHHILEDGRIETHEAAVSRLLGELRLDENDLFRSRDELILDAYEQRGKQIAYTPRTSSEEPAGSMRG